MNERVIRILPESVVNKIAAGEVIHAPVNVVKELVENSIDARATLVKVYVVRGGIDLIKVWDNGTGMSAADARLCFERHATSKIYSEEDLHNIHTRGFRGEALAALCRVARVTLETRTAKEPLGTRVIMEGGEFVRQEACSREVGTTVIVEKLFFNYPARRKALRSPRSELKKISIRMGQLVLSAEGVGFQFWSDERLLFAIEPSASLSRRIEILAGLSEGHPLIELEEQVEHVKVRGFILDEAHRVFRYLMVNGHWIREEARLEQVIERAWKRATGKETIPGYVITIEISPHLVDVNVHPAKERVEFVDFKLVEGVLSSAIARAVAHHWVGAVFDFTHPQTRGFSAELLPKRSPTPIPDSYKTKGSSTPQTNTLLHPTLFPLSSRAPTLPTSPQWLHNKFIIGSVQSGLLLISVERALTRILYEKAMNTLTQEQARGQTALFPRMVHLGRQAIPYLDQVVEMAETMGFRVRIIGRDALLVEAVPVLLQEADPEDLLLSIRDAILSEKELSKKAIEQAAKAIARLTLTKARFFTTHTPQTFIEMLFCCEVPHHTPEGAPIYAIIREEELLRLIDLHSQ